MPQFLDLTGQSFGFLSVLTRHLSPGAVRWECICKCGNTRTVLSRNLVTGKSRSCGCRGSSAKRKVKRTASTSDLPKWTAEDQAESDRILGERPPIPVPRSAPAPAQIVPRPPVEDYDLSGLDALLNGTSAK